MFSRPKLVVFDVNQTLFSLEKLRPRLRSAGLGDDALELWFALTLRDGMALSAARAPRPFLEVATSALRGLMVRGGVSPTEARMASVLEGFRSLDPEPDVRPALEILREANIRVVTLTQGSAENTERLLKRADLAQFVERCFSVDAVGPWKPNPEPYLHVLERCDVDPEDAALVAVHAWDIAGATACGLATGWASRLEKEMSPLMPPPTVIGPDLVVVARQLARAHATEAPNFELL